MRSGALGGWSKRVASASPARGSRCRSVGASPLLAAWRRSHRWWGGGSSVQSRRPAAPAPSSRNSPSHHSSIRPLSADPAISRSALIAGSSPLDEPEPSSSSVRRRDALLERAGTKGWRVSVVLEAGEVVALERIQPGLEQPRAGEAKGSRKPAGYARRHSRGPIGHRTRGRARSLTPRRSDQAPRSPGVPTPAGAAGPCPGDRSSPWGRACPWGRGPVDPRRTLRTRPGTPHAAHRLRS